MSKFTIQLTSNVSQRWRKDGCWRACYIKSRWGLWYPINCIWQAYLRRFPKWSPVPLRKITGFHNCYRQNILLGFRKELAKAKALARRVILSFTYQRGNKVCRIICSVFIFTNKTPTTENCWPMSQDIWRGPRKEKYGDQNNRNMF